ncbi:Homeobox protein ATH1 [Apostasia shenzhenica]|uniref:Homeobox protein ATH1 n=1 Tax=Apostasia shenzhenica TaxID=1088818 RepID=A0A2I0AU17_9ASPA|nr:Homeobox protein ATH1 [Apostasia shenzhenica]
MDNDVYNASSSTADHSYISSMFSSFDLGSCRQIMHADPVFPTYQEQDLDNLCVSNPALVSGVDQIGDSNFISANFNIACNASISTTKAIINSDFSIQDDRGFNSLLNYKWAFPLIQTSSTVHPSYLVGSSLSFDHSNFSNSNGNELSLSLSSPQLPSLNLTTIPDQCSEASYSGSTQASDHHSSITNGEKLSLWYGSSSSFCCSHVVYGSRYLGALQEILAELSCYAIEDVEEIDDSSSCSNGKGFDAFCPTDLPFCVGGGNKCKEHANCQLQEIQADSKKSELINMIQMV